MTPDFRGAGRMPGGSSPARGTSVLLRGGLAVLVLGILLCAHPARASSGEGRVFAGLKSYALPSGLKVILVENHAAPVVALQMWVQTGSAQERDTQAGMAHVLEHMLFKGTENRGLGEVARAVESRGGRLNAFTSYDHTVYHLEMASRDLEVGLDVLADAVRHSTLDAGELRKESEVILEEFRRSRDRPASELYRRLFASSFKVHPYRRPVIGYEETFKTFTREELLGFYRRWYRPDNMFLVVVGDVDPSKVAALVERHLGPPWVGDEKLPEAHLPAEPPQDGFRSLLFHHPSAKAHLAVGFHIPGARYPMVQALDALALVLGQGQSSRLYRRVKEERQLVHSISSYALTPRDPGLFMITAVLDPPRLEAATAALMQEVFRLAREGPTEEELEKAKINLISEFIYDQETMEGQARSLGYFESVMGDAAAAKTYVERVKALTAEDLRRVASMYLQVANATAVVLLPEGVESPLKEADLGKIAEGAREAAGEPAQGQSAARAGVTKERLANGVTLLVKENHAVPTVAIRAALLGGLRFERPETNGVSQLAASLLTQGSARHTAAEMATAVESMAGRLEGFSGRNSLGLAAEFLSEDWERGLGLVAEALLSPAFEAGEVEKKKADLLAAIAQRKDDLFHDTLLLFSQNLYDGHPYAMDPLGTEASVSSLTRQEIAEFYSGALTARNLVVAVVGDVEAGAVRRSVEKLFGPMAKEAAAPLLSLPQVGPLQAPREATEKRNKSQAHVMYGFPGVRLDSPDRYPLEVIEGVLAGQSGRLFVELRDKRGLAYALTAFAQANLDPGFVAVYVGTSPEKVEEVLEGIRRELRRLVEEPVGAEELEAAKRAISGEYELRHQTNAAQAESLALMELYGLGYQAVREYPEKIQAVTREDLQRVARRYLTLDRYVLALVRPPEAHEAPGASGGPPPKGSGP